MVQMWRETVDEIGKDEFDRAFGHVLKTSPFRPNIALIREAAGLDDSSPSEREARAALTKIICTMREHKAELKPIPGKIICTHNDEGQMLANPPREPEVLHEPLGERVEAAIAFLGDGSRAAGLAEIACHPSLPWVVSEPAFRVRNAVEIERRWVSAWRQVL